VQGWVVWVGLRCAVPVLATSTRLVWERVAVAQGLACLVVVVVCAVGWHRGCWLLVLVVPMWARSWRAGWVRANRVYHTVRRLSIYPVLCWAGTGAAQGRGMGRMPMGGRAAEWEGRGAMVGSGLDCWGPRGLWRDRC
jgi:hypothetical protein